MYQYQVKVVVDVETVLYSDRKKYQQKHLEERNMACDNIDCSCEGCTCDPCTCTVDNPCGCDDNTTAKHKSRPTGRIENEWKGLV